MQKIVIVANGAAYGSESLFNSLRLAIALREQDDSLDLRLFDVGRGNGGNTWAEADGRLQYSANAGDPDRTKCAGETVQNLHRWSWHHHAAVNRRR